MNIAMKLSKGFLPVLFSTLPMAVAFGTASAKASVLLTIDDSNPSAVVITATGENSDIDFSADIANDGVDLLGFFSSDASSLSGIRLTGNLYGGNLTVPYNDVFPDNYSTSGGNDLDLEMFVDILSPGEGDSEVFSTSQPAFTGSWTIDFSSLGIDSLQLPTAGSHGNILSGYSADSSTAVIGTWQVGPVPEPSSMALAGVGLLGFGAMKLRRRQKTAVFSSKK